jgi:Legionella pneumophila major outer membrane protein precursor
LRANSLCLVCAVYRPAANPPRFRDGSTCLNLRGNAPQAKICASDCDFSANLTLTDYRKKVWASPFERPRWPAHASHEYTQATGESALTRGGNPGRGHRPPRGMRVMRNRWIIPGLMVAAGLFSGPGTERARAQSTAWDISGNEHPQGWSPIGTYQHDGSGFYGAVEFMMLNQPRAIGNQGVAYSGFVDSAGLLTGTPGAFLGTGAERLTTSQFGRTGWSPGQRLTVGYRLDNGWNFSLSWLHLYDTKYSGGAGTQGPDFFHPGNNLENTFLFAPVFNFSSQFIGPVARNTTGGLIATNGFFVFGALNGIWNGATDMTILFTQRFDNWDLTGRFPVYETENARSYAMAGARFAWIWERFQWRTSTLGYQVTGLPEGAPPQLVEQADWAARYINSMSQRMYGPFIGTGHEVMLYSGQGGSIGAGVECTGALLVDIVKERVKYEREDQATEAKRGWAQNRIVPNIDISFNLTYQPMDGLTFKAGWNMYNFFNTLYMEKPVGFDFGAIDPTYSKKAWRLLHGCNFGVGYTF